MHVSYPGSSREAPIPSVATALCSRDLGFRLLLLQSTRKCMFALHLKADRFSTDPNHWLGSKYHKYREIQVLTVPRAFRRTSLARREGQTGESTRDSRIPPPPDNSLLAHRTNDFISGADTLQGWSSAGVAVAQRGLANEKRGPGRRRRSRNHDVLADRHHLCK